MIRQRAEAQRRTISGYVLNIVMRAVRMDEQFFQHHQRIGADSGKHARGSRTTMLIRCLQEEAGRIRVCAERRDTNISAFVLHALHRAWTVESALAVVAPAIELPRTRT